MKGFDAEFQNLDHYIRVITERIWEGRRIGDIERYYGVDCAVETPGGVSIGVPPVVSGTLETLAMFPDRQLLAEDIIVSGDDSGGFLSSHRILSPMTHAGAGAFGAATGRRLHARTIADCVCVDNRIVHEWLVRDQAAIARQIGVGERALAQRWLDERGGFNKPAMPVAPAPYRSAMHTTPLAQRYAGLAERLWHSADVAALAEHFDSAACVAAPGGDTLYGVGEIQQFWVGLLAAFSGAELRIEHLAEVQRPSRPPAVAMRWRVRAQHTGRGRYGEPSGRPVEILAISHAEFHGERIAREWVLIDDVATWMQILLSPSTES